MNYLTPYKFEDININNIIFSRIKKHNIKKIILIKYNDNNNFKKLVFQTPTLLNLYDSVNYENYSEIEVGLVGKKNRKVDNFINFLDKLEKKVVTEATNNIENWFDINNKKILLKNIIRKSEEIKKGTLKIKILNNNKFKTILQSNINNNITISDIKTNMWTKMLLEFYAIWINDNNEFGIYLRPILISFSLLNNYNYNIIKDSESESETDIPDTENNTDIFIKNDLKDFNKLLKESSVQTDADVTELNLEFSNDNKINLDDINSDTSEDI